MDVDFLIKEPTLTDEGELEVTVKFMSSGVKDDEEGGTNVVV